MGTNHTTIAKLRRVMDTEHGAVLQYGKFVFLIDRVHGTDYSAAIYQIVDESEEKDKLEVITESEEIFQDAGHAAEWCLRQGQK